MALVAAFTLAGCGSMMQQNRTVHYSSSLYSYLNTNDTAQANSPLPMPLKVGIAFVPANIPRPPSGRLAFRAKILRPTIWSCSAKSATSSK